MYYLSVQEKTRSSLSVQVKTRHSLSVQAKKVTFKCARKIKVPSECASITRYSLTVQAHLRTLCLCKQKQLETKLGRWHDYSSSLK